MKILSLDPDESRTAINGCGVRGGEGGAVSFLSVIVTLVSHVFVCR